MTTFINFNGSHVQSDKPIITASNRGLRYGDGLFETMRAQEGELILGRLHFERLFAGLDLLQFERPAFFTREELASQIRQLCEKNGHRKLSRIRLMVFRGNGGLNDEAKDGLGYIIESVQLGEEDIRLNEVGLSVALFSDGKKSCDRFSNLKSNNFLLYTMAARYAKKCGADDCLVLNAHGRACESTIANLFCFRDNILYTTPLSEGCVSGVMRRFLLQLLPAAGYNIVEKPLTITDIAMADELFLTNAIRGIRWVHQFEESRYLNIQTSAVFELLRQNLAAFI